MRVLVLGGTGDGRRLANALVERGVEVTSSLAGRTTGALLPAGEVQVGGFGGVSGLADWLREHQVEAVVDATHPFAATMHGNAFEACRVVGVPMVHLSRPSWAARDDAAGWTWVDSHDAAALAAEGLLGGVPGGSGTVLLTVGRQNLDAYHGLPSVVARVAEDDGSVHPSGWELLVARGPFTAEGERELLRRVDVLVSKDSGGSEGVVKLDAARELGVAVVMVRRTALPGSVVYSADEVVRWLEGVSGGGPSSS